MPQKANSGYYSSILLLYTCKWPLDKKLWNLRLHDNISNFGNCTHAYTYVCIYIGMHTST